MTGGTSNIVRIFGSTYADYGISSNGPDRDVFSEAPCVDRWDMFDQDHPGPFDLTEMRDLCATCPALDLCKQGENVTSIYDIHGFRAGKTRDERRAEFRGEEYTRPRAALTDEQWHAEFRTGDAIKVIAERVGLTRDTVAANRRRLGYHGGQGSSTPTTEPVDSRARDRGFAALFNTGHTIVQAAHRMGTTRSTAARIRVRLVAAGRIDEEAS